MKLWNPKTAPEWEIRVLYDAYDNVMAAEALEGLCEGVVRANMVWLAKHPEAPCCLGLAGVKYIGPQGCPSAAKPGIPCQTVLTTPEILRVKLATCIDIANHTTAYLRLRGVPASTLVDNMVEAQTGHPIPGMFHILTQTPEGVIDYTQDLIDGNQLRCFQDCQIPIRPTGQYAGELNG